MYDWLEVALVADLHDRLGMDSLLVDDAAFLSVKLVAVEARFQNKALSPSLQLAHEIVDGGVVGHNLFE